VQALLPHLRNTTLLAGSMVLAMLGCLILAVTATPFGASAGIVFVGAGFASIYPLVAEKINHRFPNYHPGFYNGIVSLALTGGFLAPCMLGYLASWSGVRIVMLLPLFGTIMVLLLFAAISVESRGLRQGIRTSPSPRGPS
jgi:MFS family permease